MDWFFDEWLYKMGHPVFRVTQDYDAANKILSLKVRQEQRPDPESTYPQVAFFQTPVDIEIGTANSTRVERVQIEAKEEQTFKLAVDSEPLLVLFHATFLVLLSAAARARIIASSPRHRPAHRVTGPNNRTRPFRNNVQSRFPDGAD